MPWRMAHTPATPGGSTWLTDGDHMQSYKSSSRHIFKHASITATLSGAGVASGLILDALILSAFGVGYQTDAFLTALTLPLLITSVFSIQGPKVLVPVFTEYFGRNDHPTAWGLLSNLLTVGFFVFAAICLAGMALSGVIVPVQILGLEATAVSLAVQLSRMLFGLVVCQGLASILQSALFAQQRYLFSSSGKLVTNSVTIIVVACGYTSLGIHAVAAGMLLGAFVHVAVLALALSAQGFQYRWVCQPSDLKLREIATAFRYPLTGHVLGEAGTLLQNFLGSFLGSGSLTVVRYASRIVQAMAGILLGSVVQVTLPLVSKHAAVRDVRAQRKTLLESIQLLCGVGLPISIWLVLAAQPMLVLLFERGAFSRADAALTGVIIGLMTPDILLGRIVSVAQTLFYANNDLRTPFMSTLIFTFAHTVLAILLVGLLGVLGLPIAVSLASLSNTIYMIWKLQCRFGPIGWHEMWGFACRLSAAIMLATVGFTLGARLATATAVSYALAKLLDFAVPTAFGFCSFMTGALLFRLIDCRFFLPGRARRSRFFDQSA
jgi:putative peptidoglycan lipid II flippase